MIETRRMDLLERLSSDVHPLTILQDLEQSPIASIRISDEAADAIREGLADPRRRKWESSALAKVKLAAQTADGAGSVYLIESFRFENIGSADGVIATERSQLNPGEIECHSHVSSRPEYLGQVDAGDLIAAIEGPAWLDPGKKQAQGAIRIFGILSVHKQHLARLQFYFHDLRDTLEAWNDYGLKKFGMPITLPDAY